MDMGIEVDIEYCGTCGDYVNKYTELRENILKNFPNIKVNGYEGRRASFEVKINSSLVHSKLSTLSWPDNDDVNSIIAQVSQGKENINTILRYRDISGNMGNKNMIENILAKNRENICIVSKCDSSN